jgi:hypothetical protein
MTALALLLLLQDKYYVGKDEIPLKDIVEAGGKTYVRSSAIEKPLEFVRRITADKSAVGVMRAGVGGRAMKIGAGEEALLHSQDLFLSLEALENVLNAKVFRDIGRVEIQPKNKVRDGPETKRKGLVAGDRMIDFALPPLKGKDPVQLSKQPKGKRLLVAIWASWHGGRDQLSSWQSIYEKHRNAGLVVVSIAVEAGGPERAASYLPKNLTLPSAVDPYWHTITAFGYDTFPKFLLVDELGFIRAVTDSADDAVAAWKKLEPAEDHKIKAWQPHENAAELKKAPADVETEARAVLGALPDSWEDAIRAFSALCRQGKSADAVAVLKQYLKHKDTHTLVRRQKWAAEFPDRIYAATIDEAWLRDQEEREKRGE